MSYSATTRMERAWYVDPELFSDAGAPEPDTFGDEAPWNATLMLSDADLEDAGDLTDQMAAADRPYRDVSLRGALLLEDDPFAPPPGPLDRARAVMARLPAVLPERSRQAASAIVRLFERGAVSPYRLALVSFSAGVGATLLGVLIAL